MLWKYILRIRLNNNVIYEKDMNKGESFIQDKNKELSSINITNYETLANVEVLKHGRKR